MSNTIELLESIGADASLRHASGADLEEMLEAMQATDELKLAASTGNPEPLKQELGGKSMGVNNTQNGTCEEDEEEEDKEPDEDNEKKS